MAQAKSNNSNTNLTPIILGVFGFMFYNKIFGASKEDKAGEKETEKIENAPLTKNPFMFGTYKVPKKKGWYRFTMSVKEGTKAASLIQDGFGMISDDESQIMAGIKMAKTKPDITYIVAIYERLYHHDMYTDLKKNLNRFSELGSMVNAYVNKLPDYTKQGTIE